MTLDAAFVNRWKMKVSAAKAEARSREEKEGRGDANNQSTRFSFFFIFLLFFSFLFSLFFTDEIILCDECSEQFHMSCLDPPITFKDLEGLEKW